MFNPLSKSRKLWAGLDSWGAVNMANTIQGRRSPSIYFDCLSIKRPNSGTPRSHVKIATLRPQQAAIHCAQLPGTRPAPGPGGVGHGRTSRPRLCNPVSTRRARGLANATESHDSQLCYRHTRLLCLAAARQAATARSRVRKARTDVGSSQTCAHAAPMGAGKTQKSLQVEVTGGEG